MGREVPAELAGALPGLAAHAEAPPHAPTPQRRPSVTPSCGSGRPSTGSGPPALHPWRWADAAAWLHHPCSRRGHISFPAALPSPLAALSASRAPTAALPGAWVSPELGAVGARGEGAPAQS